MMEGIIFDNQGRATSFLAILNARMLRHNQNPVNVGAGIHADHLVDPLRPYTRIQEHPTDSIYAVEAPDQKIIDDVNWVAYLDYPTNTIPRPANEGGMPPNLGNEIRAKIESGTLTEDISSWFPDDENPQ